MITGRLNLWGSRARKFKVAYNLTQEQLAARCQSVDWDVTRGTLTKIEVAARRRNDAEVVVLAKCLKVGIPDQLDGFPVR